MRDQMMHRGRLPIRWMSREALEGQRYGEPSDVWAFGVTLWEMSKTCNKMARLLGMEVADSETGAPYEDE
ncbi:unnamed protein product, partial [Mesorhabditis belari]|uniref:Protein kinase domain-containing protein n=1 Tax=Mesorhabditis belari TaxID=2138241 RepID=A0AAF3F8K0_9BILA